MRRRRVEALARPIDLHEFAFASHRALRPRFLEWGPYAACGIATLIFAPVLVWNAKHDWISFTYQIEHGLGASSGSMLRAAWRHEGDLLGGQAGLVTPILFVSASQKFQCSRTRKGHVKDWISLPAQKNEKKAFPKFVFRSRPRHPRQRP